MASSSPFLRLPLEIKRQIYGYLLICDQHRVNPHQSGINPPTKPKLYPQILTTNKQISEEAADVLYDSNFWIVISLTSDVSIPVLNSRVPVFQVPRRIGRSLQDPTKAPISILSVKTEDARGKVWDHDDGRTFMLDLRNFGWFCRLPFTDPILTRIIMTPASDSSSTTTTSDKIARFHNKVLGYVGEAAGCNLLKREADFIRDGVRFVGPGHDSTRDLNVMFPLSRHYRDLDTLLHRMDCYEADACRHEKKGDVEAAQVARFDCLELAQLGGCFHYSNPDLDDGRELQDNLKQFLDRIMNMAILCATSSLEIGNTDMISCVDTKVGGMTGWNPEGLSKFRVTEDYIKKIEHCSWSSTKDAYMSNLAPLSLLNG